MASEVLARRYDVSLLDLDGVVYLGAEAVPHAVAALAAASEAGMRHAFVTNNAARPPATVAAHLRALGVACADGDVVTSAQAAARLVAGQVEPGAAVLVVGGEGLEVALREHGLRPVSRSDEAAAVVQGFSPTLDWRLLAEGAYALAAGLPWIASNLDATVPTARGRAPGNGTFVRALITTTGRTPQVAGKPQRRLFDEAVERTQAANPLVIGDRLDTDIEGAHVAGLDSLLVLTGVTSPREAILAPPHQRATYVARDLRGLLEPARVAVRDGEVWRCGAWASLVEAARVIVVPAPRSAADLAEPDDGIDAVRAACAAAAAYAGPIDDVDGLPAVL